MDLSEDQRKALIIWWHRRNVAVACAVALLAYYFTKRREQRNVIQYGPTQSNVEKEKVRQELMTRLKMGQSCRNVLRMGPEAFQGLCDLLRAHGGLQDTQRAPVEEQVAKFLHILSHNVKNRTISFFFCRSGETVSRHFHRVLDSIIELEDIFLMQPDGTDVPPEILNSSRFYPYFKDCIGALDGTHIRVKVSNVDAPRYRGRKGYPTQNVLAACSFDLKFTYVLPGWEGTPADSRIIKDALTRTDKLKIPEGKYYLVDAGYMNKSALIAPFRGVRYHLKEYSNRPPENSIELFNLRHASLRNAIERAFGVLKKRFPIIGSSTEPVYSFNTQTKIILACCIIHNYLMGVDPDEELIAEVDREILQQTHRDEQCCDPREDDEDSRRGEYLRYSIANEMWGDYVI